MRIHKIRATNPATSHMPYHPVQNLTGGGFRVLDELCLRLAGGFHLLRHLLGYVKTPHGTSLNRYLLEQGTPNMPQRFSSRFPYNKDLPKQKIQTQWKWWLYFWNSFKTTPSLGSLITWLLLTPLQEVELFVGPMEKQHCLPKNKVQRSRQIGIQQKADTPKGPPPLRRNVSASRHPDAAGPVPHPCTASACVYLSCPKDPEIKG